MMKRIAATLLSLLLVLSLLAGCAAPSEETPTPDVTTTTSTQDEVTDPTEGEATDPTEGVSTEPTEPSESEATASTEESTTEQSATEQPVSSGTTQGTAAEQPTTQKPTATVKPIQKPTTAKPTAKPTATKKPTVKPSLTKTVAKPTTTTTQHLAAAKLNGVSLSLYTVVYPADGLDYVIRAAAYICDEILARTGAEVAMVSDKDQPKAGSHEILVGETNRPLSKALNVSTKGVEFAMQAKDGHVAMEAEYFVIAAAAYYFIQTYVPNKNGSTTVSTAAKTLTPITEKADNIIFLIGDGMGVNQTKLIGEKGADKDIDYTDGESFFYGELLPYAGHARTNSLDGITDSAASATALATGCKTTNGRIGRDKDKNDLFSITEMSLEMGKRACVMSTEGLKGATPAGFSAHADSRDDGSVISDCQGALSDKYPIIFTGDFNIYTDYGVERLEQTIRDNLRYVNKSDKGFFLMYEEAYIDKHSHNQDKEMATWAVYRFNQAIATFMEFAFYNPNTAVIITADHETGGLQDIAGVLKYAHGNHTGRDVPVFAYGQGMEVFHGKTVENVQIPKTLAKLWGKTLAAATDDAYPPLN